MVKEVLYSAQIPTGGGYLDRKERKDNVSKNEPEYGSFNYKREDNTEVVYAKTGTVPWIVDAYLANYDSGVKATGQSPGNAIGIVGAIVHVLMWAVAVTMDGILEHRTTNPKQPDGAPADAPPPDNHFDADVLTAWMLAGTAMAAIFVVVFWLLKWCNVVIFPAPFTMNLIYWPLKVSYIINIIFLVVQTYRSVLTDNNGETLQPEWLKATLWFYLISFIAKTYIVEVIKINEWYKNSEVIFINKRLI